MQIFGVPGSCPTVPSLIFGRLLPFVFALNLAVFSASAQVQPPTTAVPTREELKRTPIEPPRAEPRRITVEGDVERAPCPLAGPQFDGVSFVLARVDFQGLQELDAQSLAPAWEEYRGRTVPLAVVCDIRDRAATILRRVGYLAAVQVPPQAIEGGVVRLDVLMARVVAVQVLGDPGRSERMIAGFLRAIQEMPVFNEIAAERHLLLMRDLPGYDVRLTLRPAGTTLGEIVGQVTVTHTPIQVDANVQNYGSSDVGRWGGLLRTQFNGLTGLGDRTVLSVFSTAEFEEQQVLQLGHDFGVGYDGLRVRGQFTHAWTNPTMEPDFGVEARTLIVGGDVSYPFLRTQTANLRVTTGFEVVNQNVELLETLTNRDRLRIAYVHADFDAVDRASLGILPGYSLGSPRWRVSGSFEFRQGLDIMSATDACASCPVQPSRVPGEATGTVLRTSAFAEYRPVPALTVRLAPRIQYSPDALLAFEEFSAGNFTVGRGYNPGALAGDSGLGIQAEVEFSSFFFGARNEFGLRPFLFLDVARVWNTDDRDLGAEHLYSLGAGLRAAFSDRARLDLTAAVPLSRVGLLDTRPDPRLLLSITTRLLPWKRR